MLRFISALFVVLSLASAGPASAKSYSAARFDSTIRLVSGGALDITETVVFHFDGGPFERVFREIPERQTDGIEIVGASMDGRRLTFGTDSGQVEVRRGSRVRVTWRFAPRSDASHTFTLNYVVRGVVRKDGGDVLEWIALPTEHAYRIESSEIVIESPARPLGQPRVDTRRVDSASTETSDARVQIVARSIGKNGWVKARLTFADGTLIAAAPLWQRRQLTARSFAGRWITAGAMTLAVGLIFLIALRQRYDRPSGGQTETTHLVDTPPDTHRPALAGALASNGRVGIQHAMATLVALAARGVVSIAEEPRRWGQRRFIVRRNASIRPAAPEETTLLDLAFPSADRGSDAESLTKVRSRVSRGIREFQKAVHQELRAQGLLDEDRARVRSAYLGWSLALLVLAVLLLLPAAMVSGDYGAWPLAIPAAVAAVSIAGFIFYGAMTPLSNDGVRRGAEWRAYQRYLKEIARDRRHTGGTAMASMLPFAIALGLAGVWSKFVKQHPGDVPPWFRTVGAHDDGAFPAFIATGGADAGAGGHGGGGGAAGGGSSGAS